MDISKDISEAIAKNLPQAVGTELQAVLAQASKDAAQVVKLTADVATMSTALGKATATITEKMEIINQHAALAVREAAVLKREQDIDVRELRQEVAAEKRVSTFAVDVVTKLVRNTDYRHSVMANGNVPVMTPSGNGMGYVNTHPTNQTTAETRTAE